MNKTIKFMMPLLPAIIAFIWLFIFTVLAKTFTGALVGYSIIYWLGYGIMYKREIKGWLKG